MTLPAEVRRFVDPAADALLRARALPRKALFLDRDGIVNVDSGYVHQPAQTRWVPGIFELVAAAHALEFVPVIVTNQAGIARGFYDEAQFMEYTRWVHAAFAARDTPLLATFFCPHHPEAGAGTHQRKCVCRKPEPGMIVAAADAYGIDLAQSFLIGDKPSDIQAGLAAGVAGTHLYVGNGTPLPALRDMLEQVPAHV